MFFRVPLCLETPYTMPIPHMVTMSEVLPAEMSGSGRPVGGIQPLTTSALSEDCTAKARIMPETSI